MANHEHFSDDLIGVCLITFDYIFSDLGFILKGGAYLDVEFVSQTSR